MTGDRLSEDELIEINNDLIIKFLTSAELHKEERIKYLRRAKSLIEKNLEVAGDQIK